ncbi:PKD domain-containing protein [Flavobacteriaceae bacterium]|nr:PKD domain-containing protein [Flavobacteriaceae bacterium]
MKNLFRKIKQVSILILAISFMGCDDDAAVLPKLTAGFTHTINANTGTVTFINTSTNASMYAWDFGDESTSSLINPVNVYENGTYIVVLKSSNVAGDFDIFSDEIIISIPEVATLPITFDGENTKYDPTVFDGTTFEILSNPDLSGTNAVESNVGAITNSGATYEGLFFELGAPVDLTTEKSIKMNFWSDSAIDVLLKLEDGTAANTEATASHTGSGWEEIIFTFNSAASYNQLTLFVDGAGTTDGTFYFDDIIQVVSPPTPCSPETVESLAASDFNLTFMADPTASIINDGTTFEWIDNPDFDNTVNTSCKVGKITKLGNNAWDNNQINLDAKLDLITNEGLKIKVWSAKANTEVRIKLEENGTPANNVEKFVTTSVTEGWEELSFAFTGDDSDKYDKVVLFFDLDANNTDTYYFDDLTLYGTGTGPLVCDPETAQSLAAADFNLTFMSDPTASIISDGAGFAWIDNPDFDNTVNTSCKVGQIDRTSAALYANNQIIVDTKLDFDANSGFKLKVWSPTASTNVLLKLEDQTNAGTFKEVSATTSATSAGEWEELTFDFDSTDSNKFDKIVLFFQLATTIQETYYIDDLKLYGNGNGGGGGGGGNVDGDISSNGGFETGDLEGWTLYDNGGSATMDNTEAQTGDWCVKLFASAPSGLNPTLKQERKAAGSIVVGDKVQVTFSYKGSLTGESGTVSIQSFVEATDGASQIETFDVTPTNTWQTFTTTYTVTGALQGGDVSGGITMQFVAICGGVAGCSSTLYLDDISLILNP